MLKIQKTQSAKHKQGKDGRERRVRVCWAGVCVCRLRYVSAGGARGGADENGANVRDGVDCGSGF